MDNTELDLLYSYECPQDPQISVFLDHRLKIYYYNHVPQRRDDIRNYQRICSALLDMRFYHPSLLAQIWAPIEFETGIVLTTCGQPFGLSMYTNELWSYRVACLDHNSYVDHNTKACIGPPGRVFHNKSPEWTQDVRKYNDKQYPQLEDAKRSHICSSLFMPVIEGGQCIFVLELAMTNLEDNLAYEMHEVCRALEKVGLKSSVQNENINFDTLKDYSPASKSRDPTIKDRNSKSKKITCNDITKLFGVPKADATKICRIWYNYNTLSKNTFTEAHQRYGVDKWPCIRNEIVKSSAHKALIEHAKAFLTSSDVARQIKHIDSQLMQDNDDITFEGDLVDTRMDYLISNDGKRVREQLDESANLVLLELYRHENKRLRN